MTKIKYLFLICAIYFGSSQQFIAQETFKTGADRHELYLPLLKDKKVGIVTNHTGVTSVRTIYNGSEDPNMRKKPLRTDTISIVDFLVSKKIKISKIFSPEHGFRGDADAGELVKNGVDTKTNLPIVSLYGNNKKPKAEQLKDIDIILFDIQDVGARFYTYIYTLTYVMEAAAENNIEVILLDRPNPHDGYIDGPVLKKKWASFIGMHPIPVVYGLTIGEYGNMVNGEKWMKNGIKAKYTVIPMQGYSKTKRYPISGKPSPNLPNDKSINLYPSLCFFEGTEVSVGRGTTLPFQIYGSPGTKNYPYKFTPKPSYGAKDPFLNGQLCYGKDLSNYPKELRQVNLEWLLNSYKNYKSEKDFFLKNLFFDKLAGSDELRKQIISGKTEKEIRDSWKKDLESFEKIRAKYILYKN